MLINTLELMTQRVVCFTMEHFLLPVHCRSNQLVLLLSRYWE